MAEIHWVHAVDGKFTKAADWAGGAVPGAGDDAVLDAGGARFTVASAVKETVNSLQLASYAALNITAGLFTAVTGTGGGANWGTISIGDRAGLALGGLVDNAGVIGVNGLGDTTRLTLVSDTTLGGGGVVTLSDYVQNQIVAAPGATVTLTNKNDTISGSGAIGGGQGGGVLTLRNAAFGVIDADGENADLVIGPNSGSGSLVNAGLIEATGRGSGPSLLIQNVTITGAGRLFAASRSTLDLTNCTLSGQTLSTAAFGAIDLTGSGAVTLGAKLVNAGSIDFAQTSPIVLSRSLTLSGGGSVSMQAGVSAAAPLVLTNQDNTFGVGGRLDGEMTLVNEAKGAIVGLASCVIDAGSHTVVNQGMIETFSGRALTIASAIDNTGTLETNGGGTITLDGAVANNGTLVVDGGTITLGGAVTGGGAAVIHGGTHGATLDCAAGFTQDVTFVATHAVLELAQSQTYTGAVSGFAFRGATTFDLRDIAFVGSGEASFSGTAASGVLTVGDGTHTAHITLIGDYVGWTFVAESDGAGGTLVLDPGKTPGPAPPLGGSAPAPHAFIAAMAGAGARSAGVAHAGEASTVPAPRLARPHATPP